MEVINSGPVASPPSSASGTGDLEDGGHHKNVVFEMDNNNDLSTLNDEESTDTTN